MPLALALAQLLLLVAAVLGAAPPLSDVLFAVHLLALSCR